MQKKRNCRTLIRKGEVENNKTGGEKIKVHKGVFGGMRV